MNLAGCIDHTSLKPDASNKEIQQLCKEAIEYGFSSVCVTPYYVSLAATILKGTEVKVAAVAGFPLGYTEAVQKQSESLGAVKNGAQEVDYVMNIAAFKNKNFKLLEEEARRMTDKNVLGNVIVKVIVETGLMTNAELIKCCELFADLPIDFMKTSTGFGPPGASVAAVTLMRKYLPNRIAIKASGGIRNFADAYAMLHAGATRLGTSAGVQIMQEFQQQ